MKRSIAMGLNGGASGYLFMTMVSSGNWAGVFLTVLAIVTFMYIYWSLSNE